MTRASVRAFCVQTVLIAFITAPCTFVDVYTAGSLQLKARPATTGKGAIRVGAFVLTTAVVSLTFVDICGEDLGQNVLLFGIIISWYD